MTKRYAVGLVAAAVLFVAVVAVLAFNGITARRLYLSQVGGPTIIERRGGLPEACEEAGYVECS